MVDHVGEGLTGELVDDMEDLGRATGGGDVELVVERPHVVGAFGPQPVGSERRGAEALPLALPRRNPQTLLPPQALDLLAVEHVARTSTACARR